MPALPLDEAGKYVAAAYLVFLLLVLIYVSIMASKISRIEREVGELLELTDDEASAGAPEGRRKAEAGPSPAVHDRPGRPATPSGRGAGSPAEVTDQ